MDAIVNKAIEEVCISSCKGNTPLPINQLWPKLKHIGLVLCHNVKKAILSNLVNIPGLEFETKDGVRYPCHDVKFTLEECERLELNIVVPERMVDEFIRIHEVEVSKFKFEKQELEALHRRKRILRRIAIARANGIAQSELTREFDTTANKIFHVLKGLEALGLIVMHEAMLWETETSKEGKLISKHTSTNMLYLSLYAKHLRCQQRLEIRKGGLVADDDIAHGNSSSCDVKTSRKVCDKPEKSKRRKMMDSYVCDLAPPGKTSTTDETIPRRCRAKAYPYHKLQADRARAQREQWILRKLEEDKFLIKPELRRQLESLDKDKHTSMDKKTLERSLNKLQQQGHCKCLDVVFPAVTNCCQNRKTVVVLHPSIYELSPELLVKIYDRNRSFEMEARRQSIENPTVYGVGRGEERAEMDAQGTKSHGNRSLMAKMVRAKLLHIYLWEYVSNSPDSGDSSSSYKHSCDLKNDDNSYKLVDMGAAIEAMPLELFLKVSGSVEMHENMFEKHEDYLHLSNIPMKDYACLKEDIQSIEKLSLLISILQSYGLIRLVCGGHTVDVSQVMQFTLTHALELKPYIEKHVSSAAQSSAFHCPDSCHPVRHDFVLSSRKAVDVYWNTLEYFLAGANPKAASNVSPGTAVQEVFHSFHNRKQKRLCRFQGVLNARRMEVQPIKGQSTSSNKRKRSSGGEHSRHVKLPTLDGRPSDKSTSDTVGQSSDAQIAFLVSPGDSGCDSQKNCVDDHREVTEAMELYEKTESNHSFMKKSASNPASFSWTEDADRQLVIEFARRRAALGPSSHCFKWASVRNLPASPDACKRRMAILNGCIQFRIAIMELCNVLSERYARYLQNRSSDYGDCEEMVLHHASAEEDGGFDSHEYSREAVAEERWDNFDDDNVNIALEKVLECKKMAKLDRSKEVQSSNDNSDINGEAKRPGKTLRWIPKRCDHPLVENNSVCRQAFESVAVANAVELIKVAFLTTSRSQLVPTSLVETTKHYSKHDIFDAFNFLKEKKLIESRADNAVAFSGKFFDSRFPSQFPNETGEQAAKFSTWLHERENEMIENGVDLPPDLQCGDVLNLCGLLSSGKLSIVPCLPDEGVGEAKDARTLKRKHNISEFWDGNRSKKSRPLLVGEGEARRAKGFPGITLSLSHATFSGREAVELFKNDDAQAFTHISEKNRVQIMSVIEGSSSASHLEDQTHVKETHENEKYGYTIVSSTESLWEAMASCAEHFCSFSSKKESFAFNPELFRSLVLAIQSAGDQGLSMKEISMSFNVQGEQMLDVIVDVLEAFGRVLKVNAYDSVHVVDSLYCSKYVLSTVLATRQDPLVTLEEVSKAKGDDKLLMNKVAPSNLETTDAQKEVGVNIEFYRLANQEQPLEPLSVRQSTNGHDSLEFQTENSRLCKPILPWIDGDGTVNNVVYRRLVSRVLGIIMQNPGILEDNIISQMHGLNPQSCRTLLGLMILDNHIIVRKMFETIAAGPPAILSGLLGTQFKNSKIILKRHLFANPMSTSLL